MSEWKVSRNPMVGYQVYRRLNENGIDHSGNREYDRGCYKTKAEAQKRADELNRLDRVSWFMDERKLNPIVTE